MRSYGGSLSNILAILLRRGDSDTDTHRPREDPVKTQLERSHHKPRTEVSEEIKPVCNMSLDFEPAEV